LHSTFRSRVDFDAITCPYDDTAIMRSATGKEVTYVA
jgi:hypothetical protein